MLLTHHFGSVETLDRARQWLTHLGFEVANSDSPEHDRTRLVMNVDLSRVSAALALIDSVERADSLGWPGFHDLPTTLRAHGGHASEHPAPPSSTRATAPIHWQAHHEPPPVDPHCCKVCEYMFGRPE